MGIDLVADILAPLPKKGANGLGHRGIQECKHLPRKPSLLHLQALFSIFLASFSGRQSLSLGWQDGPVAVLGFQRPYSQQIQREEIIFFRKFQQKPQKGGAWSSWLMAPSLNQSLWPVGTDSDQPPLRLKGKEAKHITHIQWVFYKKDMFSYKENYRREYWLVGDTPALVLRLTWLRPSFFLRYKFLGRGQYGLRRPSLRTPTLPPNVLLPGELPFLLCPILLPGP